ncbi:MAG: zinc ribbon domain-containing protein [Candidatus Binataceae bacterium]
MFCPKCGHANLDDARYCRNCSARLPSGFSTRNVVFSVDKSPGLAAVLSFFWCGLGQIYNGQIFKGLVMVVLYAFSVFLMHFIIGFITTPILWIWGIVNAYRTAERMRRQSPVTT